MTATQHQILKKCESFLKGGYTHKNPPALQAASLAIYRELAKGQPAAFDEIASHSGLNRKELVEALALLPGNTIDYNGAGDIIGFVGFSLRPANHKFFIGRKTFYTWCVFDAWFLPSLLRTNARLETRCPASGQKLVVQLSPNNVPDASPPGAVASLVAADNEDCCQNLRTAFCDHVNLFRDWKVFENWRKDKGIGNIIAVPVKEAFALALRRNQWRYPDVGWKAIN